MRRNCVFRLLGSSLKLISNRDDLEDRRSYLEVVEMVEVYDHRTYNIHAEVIKKPAANQQVLLQQ